MFRVFPGEFCDDDAAVWKRMMKTKTGLWNNSSNLSESKLNSNDAILNIPAYFVKVNLKNFCEKLDFSDFFVFACFPKE